MSTFTVAVPYHCPKCRSASLHMTFDTLADLRDHVIKVHLKSNATDDLSVPMKSSSLEDMAGRRDVQMDLLLESRSSELAQQRMRELKKEVEKERIEKDRRRRMKEIEERDQKMSGKKLIQIVPSVKDSEQDNEEEHAEQNERYLQAGKSMDENRNLKEKLLRQVDNIFQRNDQVDEEIKKFTKYKKEAELSAKVKKVSDVLQSCDAASEVVAQHFHQTDPDMIARLLSPASTDPSQTVLAQMYMHAFNVHYQRVSNSD